MQPAKGKGWGGEKKKMVTKVEKWLEKRGRVEEKPGVSSGLASKSGDSLNEF